jgi:hypothetical protein
MSTRKCSRRVVSLLMFWLTMMNLRLREKLLEITKSETSKHWVLLEELKCQIPHSIRTAPISDMEVFLEDFICFEYAFNLIYSDRYAATRDQPMLRPVGANADFVEFLLNNNAIDKSCAEAIEDGDIVLYFSEGKVCHAGKLHGGRIISKWGAGLLLDHELFEVPSLYGDDVMTFKQVQIEEAEGLFQKYLALLGWDV